MSPWIIEGRDPLIFRDGRPLGGNSPIETMDFPSPGTLAGAARGRLATDPASGAFTLRGDSAGLQQLLKIPVHGPILAEIDPAAGTVVDWLLPAPRDALVRENDAGEPSIIRLSPRDLAEGECIGDIERVGLRPLFPTSPLPSRKPRLPPTPFWRESTYTQWLLGETPTVSCLDELGAGGLPRESRMHVSMRQGERVAEDGALFETVGLRFLDLPALYPGGPPKLSDTRHLALSIRTPGGRVKGEELTLRREAAPLGGERRIARWWAAPERCPWPRVPEPLIARIIADRRARLLLVTPAIFAQGALPGWSGSQWPSDSALRVTVRAACVPSPQVISGWDLQKRGPKPTRRMAPAGSVYFVELKGSDAEIRAWVDATWLQTISDASQDRLDGFGLTTIGTWSD